jgi:signal transduction histidine kinase
VAGLAPRLRRAAWPAGLVIGLGAEWLAHPGQSPSGVGADLVVGWTFIACGLVQWSRRPQSLIGPLITLTGFTWFLGTLAASSAGAVAALGAVLLTLHRGPLFHAIVGYPSGRPSSRLGLGVAVVGYVYAGVTSLALNNVATITVVLLVLATAIREQARGVGPQRRARATATVAAAALTLPLVGGTVGRLMEAGAGADRAVLWGYEAVLVLIAVGFTADLLLGRWAQAAVTRLVVDLGGDSESGTLRGRLARALGDRSLEIAYWVSEAKGYVDERGNPVALPGPGSARVVTEIAQDGQRIGALVHDPTVLDDARLVERVASAAKIALLNMRLQAEVRRQVEELDASRRRILEAGEAGRRRLQQDLEAGVGQRLSALQGLLERAIRNARSAPEPRGVAELEVADRELEETRIELHDLAAGIAPLVLTERGLGPALSVLAQRTLVPVQLVAPSEHLPAVIETAVYFVCSEAVVNAQKHARASRVDVEVKSDGGLVTVTIADDGIGGASPSNGSGLRGVSDRIEALGGRLLVDSPTGRGTRLLVEIPIAASANQG